MIAIGQIDFVNLVQNGMIRKSVEEWNLFQIWLNVKKYVFFSLW